MRHARTRHGASVRGYTRRRFRCRFMPLQWRHLRFTIQRRWSPKEDGRYYSTSFYDLSIPPPRGALDFDLLDGGELVGGDVVYLNQDVPRAGGERGRDAPPLQQFVHPIDNDINRQQHVARVSMLVDFLAHPLARRPLATSLREATCGRVIASGRLRRGSLRKAFAFLRCISAQPTVLSTCHSLR